LLCGLYKYLLEVKALDDRKNMRIDAKPQAQKVLRDERGQNLYIENRRKLTLSGVSNVESFNELEIVVETELGVLTVKGSSMHMSRLNLETGDLIIDGSIDSCAYSEKRDLKTKGAGFLSKLFK
jgi:sporulation protein YabP